LLGYNGAIVKLNSGVVLCLYNGAVDTQIDLYHMTPSMRYFMIYFTSCYVCVFDRRVRENGYRWTVS